MLNLTDSPITLIAESGDTTSIEKSGYVARVETTRREVSYPLHARQDDGWCCAVPLIEETPTEIVVDRHLPGMSLRGIMWEGTEIEGDALLIVTREVAEAAATLKHPLWRRMVFTHGDDAQYRDGQDENGKRIFGSLEFQGYVALRRVPQGESDA
jgi:hypothetical protein